MAAGAADILTVSARTHEVDDFRDLRVLPFFLRPCARPRDLEQLRGVPRGQPDLGHGGCRDVLEPSLVVGPVPDALSPCPPSPMGISPGVEQMYNMDPMSLVLMVLEYLDIRRNRKETFEYSLRAWRQTHLPSAAIRLVIYVPLHVLGKSGTQSDVAAADERTFYYVRSLGSSSGLAQLYLETGLLYLEGAASAILSTSYSPPSSVRLPPVSHYPADLTEAPWRRGSYDREMACRFFELALSPSPDVPLLPPEGEDHPGKPVETIQLTMPSSDPPMSDAFSMSGSRRRKEDHNLVRDMRHGSCYPPLLNEPDSLPHCAAASCRF